MLAGGSRAALLQWHAHLDVWLLVIASFAGYGAALRLWGARRRAAGLPVAAQAQKISFAAGVVALWVGADWPIHDLAENYLFSIHMVQHTIFSLIAAPLLLYGMPAWLLRKLLRPIMGLVRVVTRPLIALILFNLMIVVTHWPTVVNLALDVHPLHFFVHAVILGVSMIMWWPVIDPLPELKRLSPPGKMLYLFLQSIVPTVPASFLTFGSRPLYSFYAAAPHPWIGAVTDQRIAGLIMKIGGGALLWGVIAIIFFRWSAREQSGKAPEIAWEDFERELEVWDLRK